ncbi:MAG: ribonuclease HII [Anaerolineae bacterium]|nr:ribonuclease HII [Anaerolineae bacterium]
MRPDLVCECTWWREGYRRVAGVDEAGRGALFGPLVAAAVILPPDLDLSRLPGLADSKLLSPHAREALYDRILAEAEAVGVGAVSAATVDRAGLQKANVEAMTRALEALPVRPDLVLVDGLGPCPQGYRTSALIDGDALCASISAASIVAKVARDRLVCELATIFPGYSLECNKGYSTAEHLASLQRLGPTRLHRRSFAPVAALLASGHD